MLFCFNSFCWLRYLTPTINRPAFQQLLGDVRANRITKIIVWKLDRMSRSLLDFANLVSLYNQYNVSFESVIDNFDTSTPMGRAMLSIVMVFAQLERETIQLRIAGNYRKRAEKGFYLGGVPAFGFKKVPLTVNGYKTSTYEPDDDHANIVISMFDIYANTDISLGKLAQMLNEKGYTTNNKTKWESQKLSRILHSPTYVKSDADVYEFYRSKGVNILSPLEDFSGNGIHLYGKRKGNERKYTDLKDHNIVVALHDGIIDSKAWLKVQRKLENNVQLCNSGKSRYTWLSGIAKCGLCGYAMTAQSVKDFTVLRCSRRINFKDCGGATYLRADSIEERLWGEIINKTDELRDTALSAQIKNEAAVNRLKMELIKIEQSISNLVDAIAMGNRASIDLLNQRAVELDANRNVLRQQINDLQTDTPEVDTGKILSLIRTDLSFDEKKAIARTLIRKVQITGESNPLVIEWRF